MMELDDLIEGFYAGAVDHPTFRETIAQMARRFDGMIGSHGKKTNDMLYMLEQDSVGFDQRWFDQWTDVMTQPDCECMFFLARVGNVWSHTPGVGMVVNAIEEVPDFRSFQFENWSRPQGICHSLGVVTESDETTNSVLTVARAPDQPAFTRDEDRAMGRLGRHVARAIELRNRVRALEERLTIAQSMLDRFLQPAIVTDGAGRIVETNAAGAALLDRREGLIDLRGRLVGAEPKATERIHLLLGSAAAGKSAGTITVQRQGRRPLSVTVTPLLLPTPVAKATRPLALLLVTDPEDAEAVPADDLQQLYGLTAAEARVALAVPEHDRLQDIADHLGRSLGTVRTQLASAMAKTETRRQAELVKLLMAHGRRR